MKVRVNEAAPLSVEIRTTIRPSSKWMALDAREIWQSRELLYFFVWRDLKVRYKQTAFGALWALIQPLALMAVFTVVFSRVAGIAPEGISYPLFALVALVPWTLFAQGLLGSSNSLVDSAEIIKKVYFPRVLLPLSSAGSYLVDFAIGMTMLTVILVAIGPGLSIAGLWVVALTALTLVTSLAFGTWLAAVNVRYRDVRYAVPFLIQLWLFASPVAYSSELVPEELWFVYHLNPMAGAIEGFRWALLQPASDPPIAALVLSTGIATLAMVLGLLYFRRVERTFADVI